MPGTFAQDNFAHQVRRDAADLGEWRKTEFAVIAMSSLSGPPTLATLEFGVTPRFEHPSAVKLTALLSFVV